MSKRVYLLGAGATKADYTGSPLLDNLLGQILFENPIIQPLENEVVVFIKKYFHNNINRTLCPSIQDVLSLVDGCLLDEYCYGLDRAYLQRIKSYIVLLMAELLERKLAGDGQGITNKFVEKLNVGDTVISTNYDIVIDNALTRKRTYHYGIHCRKEITFDFPDLIRGREAVISPDFPRNYGDIQLLKLHGSLNWVYCQRCDEIDFSYFNKGAIRCMQSPQRCCNDFCTGIYESIIISPGYLKIYKNRLIKEVWRLAEVALSEAEEVIFIGYSMPHDDYEIKSMLLRGIVKNTSRPRITVVDIKENGGEQYKNLFGNIEYKYAGFEGYVNGMVSRS